MHLVNTQLTVMAGYNGEFEELVTKLGDLRKGQPGYLGQTFLHSYGNPGKYAVTSRWENIEACWQFYRSSQFASYMKGLPPPHVHLAATVGLRERLRGGRGGRPAQRRFRQL